MERDNHEAIKQYLEQLLGEIARVIANEKERDKARHESGDDYNVFSVLNLQRKEVTLHSAFIADLLDPKGSHCCGPAFLEAFLKVLGDDATVKFEDLSKVNVHTEYNIGPISKNGKRGGRIDILINDAHNAIVIENKIDAIDQKNQLLRYWNFCKENFERFELLYLNLDLTEPSEDSFGGEDFEYTLFSYKDDILSWVDECMKLCGQKVTLKETLKQYYNTLEEILGIMSAESTKELLSIATDDKNIESTLELFNNEFSIKKAIRMRFLKDLKKLAVKYDFSCNDEKFEDIAELKKDLSIEFIQKNSSGFYCIEIGEDSPANGFWYSISAISSEKCKVAFTRTLPQIWGNYDEKKKTKDYPFGWDFFWSESGRKGSGEWYNWDLPATLKDMHNGKMLSFIETEIFKKTVDGNLIGILEDNLIKS